MSAYIIININAENPEDLAGYQALARASLPAFGLELFARSPVVEVLEGSVSGRTLVILKAPSVEAARDWYTSAAYQEAIQARSHLPAFSIQIVEALGS